jgi:SAM-dependent methyltransferase
MTCVFAGTYFHKYDTQFRKTLRLLFHRKAEIFMNLRKLQKNWDEFGRTDPLWAILAEPDKEGNRWELDQFLETGERGVDEIVKYVGQLGISIQWRRALDFGCGIGRLTQPLCRYFDEVHGVDIAPSMIGLANKLNCHTDKCHYHLNETTDLKLFRENYFDFIYSFITLQHIPPEHSRNYIKEFLRVLIPGGLLIFQLPSEVNVIDLPSLILSFIPKPLLDLTYRDVRHFIRHRNQPKWEFYTVKQQQVVTFLEGNGGKVIDIKENEAAGRWWKSFRYCVTKEQ